MESEMSKKTSILEENIQQLLQTGFTSGNKPDPRLKKKTYRRLQKQLKRQTSIYEFSNTLLGLLGCLLLILVTWFALNISNYFFKTLNNTPLLIMGGIFLLNLVSIPITGYIIVKRRHHA
jgi:hypothetical protein